MNVLNLVNTRRFAVVLVLALVLSVGILGFATLAHADDWIDFDQSSYDFSGEIDYGYGGDLGFDQDTYSYTGDLDCCGSYGDCCDSGYGYDDYCDCGYEDYSYQTNYGYSTPRFSMPSFGGGSVGYSRPISYSYPQQPVTFHAPSYQAPTVTNTNVNNNNIVNNNNSTAIAIATVTPAPAPVVQYVQTPAPIVHPAPYCTITLSYNSAYGTVGQLATLTWSSQNATSGNITPNVGTVSGYGSMQVYPTNGQIYSMTVYGQGGSAVCSTQPYYVAPVVTYNNPTPYVSLSQIPYTGLELGTLGNVMYWLSMVTFAGAAAYLVLYFNGGVLALFGSRKQNVQIAMPKIAVARPALAPVAVVAETPVLSPIQLTKSAPVDTMKVQANAGETPRIVINRA
jgi:hypothetical protein